jgi:hypothetical protein
MKDKQQSAPTIRAKVERSSLGTRDARRARATVSDDTARRLVRLAAATGLAKKSGG